MFESLWRQAMAAAFAYLRERGAFPEGGDDDDDEVCFGDDSFDNIEQVGCVTNQKS